MDADGIAPAKLANEEKEAMRVRIREHYATAYRGTLAKAYEAEMDLATHAEERQKYAAALASLEQAIDVDPVFSEPRTYKGLEGIVAIVVNASAFVPGFGNVGARGDVFFFRREGSAHALVGIEPVGEDANTYESAPVEAFKRSDSAE